MRVFHVVSSGDAQSIPAELALRLPLPEQNLRVAIFNKTTTSQTTCTDDRIIEIGARSPVDIAAIFRLGKAITAFDPDIVHLHHAASSFWATWLARLGRRVGAGARRVLLKTEHNDRNHQALKNDIINALTYPTLDGIVCNSKATQSSLRPRETRSVSHNTWPIYNGVDIERVERAGRFRQRRRDEMDLTPDDFCIGTVGRFVEQKNLDLLLAGFEKVKSPKRLVLVVVGSGPLEPHLKDLANRLKVQDRVIFTGPLERDQVYGTLAAMDGFIMPSLWEGFCNAAVEALAAGLPIAASNLAVLHEVLGQSPLYFEPDSVEEIAKAVMDLSSLSSDKIDEMSDANRLTASKYALEIAADNYLKLYEELLTAGGKS